MTNTYTPYMDWQDSCFEAHLAREAELKRIPWWKFWDPEIEFVESTFDDAVEFYWHRFIMQMTKPNQTSETRE